MIVKEGSSLTIINEMMNFIKTIVLKTTTFKKQTLKKMIVFKNDRFVFDFSASFS